MIMTKHDVFLFVALSVVLYQVHGFPTTERATTTRVPGCYMNGQHYALGATISSGYDPSSNWCYGTYCDHSGSVLSWDNFNCHTTLTTTPPPTTTPMGCYYNNKWYAPGTMIEKGYDASSNWCYFTLCDENGNLLNGDNFNCKTTPPTTTPPTTVPTTMSPNHAVG
ncbi:hypothetical protein ACF0H5_003168 [Mactra antiquata]